MTMSAVAGRKFDTKRDMRTNNHGAEHRQSYLKEEKAIVMWMRDFGKSAQDISVMTGVSKSNVEKWCADKNRETTIGKFREGGESFYIDPALDETNKHFDIINRRSACIQAVRFLVDQATLLSSSSKQMIIPEFIPDLITANQEMERAMITPYDEEYSHSKRIRVDVMDIEVVRFDSSSTSDASIADDSSIDANFESSLANLSVPNNAAMEACLKTCINGGNPLPDSNLYPLSEHPHRANLDALFTENFELVNVEGANEKEPKIIVSRTIPPQLAQIDFSVAGMSQFTMEYNDVATRWDYMGMDACTTSVPVKARVPILADTTIYKKALQLLGLLHRSVEEQEDEEVLASLGA